MEKMDDIFTAEDFDIVGLTRQDYSTARRIADRANAKLAKLMGPKVYGLKNSESEWAFGEENHSELDTHTCYYFNIQPIEKKECEMVTKINKARKEILAIIDDLFNNWNAI